MGCRGNERHRLKTAYRGPAEVCPFLPCERPLWGGPAEDPSFREGIYMKKMLLMVLTALTVAAASAQTTHLVTNESEVLSWSGGSDIDPRGLVALTDSSLVYFEDDSSLPSSKEDALILIKPWLPIQSGRFTVIATESELVNLGGSGSCCAYVSALTLDDHENLYAMVADYGSGNATNFVVRLPRSQGGFAVPQLVASFFDDGYQSGKVFHRLEVDNDMLYAIYDSGEVTDHVGVNGLYVLDLNQSLPADSQDFSLLVDFQTLATVAYGSADPAQQYRILQLERDGAGHFLAFMAKTPDGGSVDSCVLLRIDTNGNASVVQDSTSASAQTGEPGTFSGHTNIAVDRQNEVFYTFQTGGGGTNDESIFRFDFDGKLEAQVSGYYQILAADMNISDSLEGQYINYLAFAGDQLYTWLTDDDQGLESLVRVDLNDTCATPNFIWPVADNLVTGSLGSGFGPRQLPSDGFRHDFHRGMDIVVPIGTSIRAVADGIVEKVSHNEGETEYQVRVRHVFGTCGPTYFSYNLHMSQVNVVEGQTVYQGDVLGLSGASASGYQHLHFEMRLFGNRESHCVNPMSFLSYSDVAPRVPVLNGANRDAGNERLFFFQIEADDEELDTEQLRFRRNGQEYVWNWVDSNRATADVDPTKLDRPVVTFEPGIKALVFPEYMGITRDESVIHVALFDTGGVVGFGDQVVLTDLAGSEAALVLQEPNAELKMGPLFETVPAQPNTSVPLQFELANNSGAVMSLDLEAWSAMQLPLTLSHPGALVLQPGEEVTVTVTVQLGDDDSLNGDAVILIADIQGQSLLQVAGREVKTD